MTASPLPFIRYGKDRTRLTDLLSLFFLFFRSLPLIAAVCLICSFLFSSLFAQPDSSIIDSILVYGNKRTDEKLIRYYLAIDSGMSVDSAMINGAKRRLKSTDLFNKVDIFPQRYNGRLRVLVIVSERTYWSLNSFGGELFNTKYGESSRRWWNAYGGLTYANFRGKMEDFGFNISFPRKLSFSLFWNKPFVGTPFFFRTGTGISYYPDLYITWDRFSLYQYTTLGRKIWNRSKVYASLMPDLGFRRWRGGAGYWDSTIVTDSGGMLIASSEPYGNTVYDVVGRDTLLVDSVSGRYLLREWNGYSSERIDELESVYRELFFIIGWVSDLRESYFDNSKGAYFFVSLKTNALYPRDRDYSYLQMDTDTRFYHRGFFKNNKAAYRLRTSVRVDSSDIYDCLYAGGEGSVRGYTRGYFPRGFISNNRIILNAEYRFPIFTTPKMDFPVLSQIHSGLKEFYYRVDGAFLADACYVWHSLFNPYRPKDQHSSGTGLGFGLRALAPTLRRSVCFDMAWGLDSEWNKLKKEFYREKKDQKKRAVPYWFPEWYLYVDMYF